MKFFNFSKTNSSVDATVLQDQGNSPECEGQILFKNKASETDTFCNELWKDLDTSNEMSQNRRMKTFAERIHVFPSSSPAWRRRS